MKSLFRSVPLLLALAAGFAVGIFYQRSQSRPSLDLLQRVPITQAAASASRSVVVLRLLRAGQTEHASAVLENYLDGDLVAFGPAYQESTSEQRASSWVDAALREARAYRLAYPHPAQDAIVGQGSQIPSRLLPPSSIAAPPNNALQRTAHGGRCFSVHFLERGGRLYYPDESGSEPAPDERAQFKLDDFPDYLTRTA